MLTEEQAAVLTSALRDAQNILIAGATSSGKTTILNVLADAIPEADRILTIEDTAELVSTSKTTLRPHSGISARGLIGNPRCQTI